MKFTYKSGLAIVVCLIAASISGAGAAVAEPSVHIAEQIAEDDSSTDPVAKHIAALEADGAEVLAISKSPFELSSGPGIGAMAFPNGCTLVVLVVKSTHYLQNDSLTSCSGVLFDYLSHTMWLQRDRWYGTETLRQSTLEYTSPAYFWDTQTLNWDCQGQGDYTYHAETFGYMEVGASAYTARDSADRRISC